MGISKKMISIIVMVLMCALVFAFPVTCYAKSATLTKAEKEKFSKCLKGGITYDEYLDLYYYSSLKQGDLFGAKFFVYDINGDGHKDVIVSGALGLRSATFSEIYMHVDGKYKAIPVNGTLKGVSSKGLNFLVQDYEGAGAKRYYSRIAYKFDKQGNIIARYSHDTTILYYDYDTETEYKNGKVLLDQYVNGKNKKIKKSTFDKTFKQTNYKKNVKMYKLTKSNVDKYLK